MENSTAKHFIGLRHLLTKYEEMLAKTPSNPSAAQLNVALAVLTHWMGREWIDRALSPVKGHPLFRLPGNAPDISIGNLLILRLRTLSEDLLNLQYVEGFRALIEGQKRNPDLESVWAELQVGRLLYIHGIDFRFVIPSNVAGEDYDVEIRAAGHTICGETKCKASSSALNAKSLTNDIKKAASEQLPKEKPGIVFLAMPHSWFEVDDRVSVELETVQAATVALRSFSRLVSVVLYTSTLAHDGTEAFEGMFHKEVPNPNHKFPEFPNGELLRYRPSGKYSDQMPSKWLRLYDLPYGVLSEYRHDQE